MDAGEEFDIRAIAPSDQRRMEAGIFNYGNDMDITNNPFEVTGLERLVELDNDNEFVIARRARADRRGRREPEARRRTDRRRAAPHVARGLLARDDGRRRVGTLTSASYSPRLDFNMGYAWVPIELAEEGTPLRDRVARWPDDGYGGPRCRSSIRRRTCRRADRVESLQGKLLIAGPTLWDPNFRRTVLLIGHHDDEGAVGVILNRASETTVAEAVPPLGVLVPPDEPVFLGGPVQPDAAVVVADFVDPSVAEFLAFDTIGFLPSETSPGVEGAVRRARVFAGFAGWGPGQLEAEMDEDSWVVEPARPSDVFSVDPSRLWEEVLRRKGSSFDLLRLMPLDPTQN